VEFDPGPTASISGTARVGSTLTAAEGNPSPTPDSFEYQWLAGGIPIGGATSKTFTLTKGQQGKYIRVVVTAKADGISDASDTSERTAQVSGLAAKHLEMSTASSTYAGNSIAISIDLLASGEPYTIRIDDTVVKTGVADSDGDVTTRVTVPLTVPPGAHTITGAGAFPDRFDTDALTLKAPSDLDLDLRSSVTKGGTQTVEVDDLLKGEEVEVRYDGTLVSPSSAVGSSSGEYKLSFPVGTATGTHTVNVTGTYDGRSTTRTFKVTSG